MSRSADAARAAIEAYYAAFNRGDWPAMLGLLTEDVAHDPNQGPRETGREAFAAFLARMARCYAERLAEIRILVSEDGRHAAAEYVVHGRYLADDAGLPPARGQGYVLPGGAFFELAAGRICRVSNHYNLPEWIRQVSR